MEAIKGFRGKYAFLSNFYESPFFIAGAKYKTAEHAFQCMKTSRQHRALIQMAPTPAEAKKVGRYVPLRNDWETIKLNVMKIVVFEKFNQNTDLLGKLIATDDAMLWEANSWGDQYWGVSLDGCGYNYLGVILMEVRKSFKVILLDTDDYTEHVYGDTALKNIF